MPRKPPSQLGLVLFVGAFTIFNVVLTCLLLIGPFAKWKAAKSWIQIPCVVEDSRISHSSGSSTSKGGSRLHIAYSYEFDGKPYHGDRYSIMPGFITGSLGMKPVIAQNPPGTKTVCYVNSANPAESVMNRGLTAYMALGLVPLLFAFTGLLWFVAFTRQRMKT